jgi:hypothetical protein
MLRVFLIVTVVVGLAACQTAGGGGVRASASNSGTKIAILNPNPQVWIERRIQTGSVFTCRALACADPATAVLVEVGSSHTREPDPQALQKLAKLIPAQVEGRNLMLQVTSDGKETFKTLSTRVTAVRGYPAIVAELKRSGPGKTNFIVLSDLFVGTALVRISTASNDLASAKRIFDSFANALGIADQPPQTARAAPLPAPAAPVPPPASSPTKRPQVAKPAITPPASAKPAEASPSLPPPPSVPPPPSPAAKPSAEPSEPPV